MTQEFDQSRLSNHKSWVQLVFFLSAFKLRVGWLLFCWVNPTNLQIKLQSNPILLYPKHVPVSFFSLKVNNKKTPIFLNKRQRNKKQETRNEKRETRNEKRETRNGQRKHYQTDPKFLIFKEKNQMTNQTQPKYLIWTSMRYIFKSNSQSNSKFLKKL